MSYTRSYHHIVFGTKYHNRTIFLDRREKIYTYITGIVKNKKCTMLAINGFEEHIHMLIDLHPSVALADLVKAVKQSSSKKISETNYLPLFEGWAPEYYACSVSPSHVEKTKTYIENQEVHHSGKTYQNEMETFVGKMGMQIYRDEAEVTVREQV